MCNIFSRLFKKANKEDDLHKKECKINELCSKLMLPDKGKTLLKHLHVTREDGFNDFTILTQAWHESGRFIKVIGEYNYWGIKKPRDWTGKVYKVRTHEYINNKRVNMDCEFIDFSACGMAVAWWIDLVKRLYPDAYKNRNNPVLFFEGLVSGKYKYATDPFYFNKLNTLYKLISTNAYLLQLLDIV